MSGDSDSSQIQKTGHASYLIGGVLGLIFLVGSVFALAQVINVVDAATPDSPILFDHGLTEAKIDAPSDWTNEQCGSCHKATYDQWKDSRHAHSGTAHNFETEFLDPRGGRQQHCINCHAPRNPFTGMFPTTEPDGIDQAYEQQPEWITSGIDCLTCHVRDGKVIVSKYSDKAAKAHPIRIAPEIGTAEFCAGCHQFGFKTHVTPDGYFGQLQQSSFEEFLDTQGTHGTTRCHECHLPDGNHRMPGGYDDEMLRKAVDMSVAAKWLPDAESIEVSVDVSAADYVGHRIPGGEHFRFITVWTKVLDANDKIVLAKNGTHGELAGADGARVVARWPQAEIIRRKMGNFEMGSDDPNDQPSEDERLKPGEVRQYRYRMPVDAADLKGPLRVRAELVYHLMDDSKAESFNHNPDDMKRLVLEKEATLDLGVGR